jgi:hypothetical protein
MKRLLLVSLLSGFFFQLSCCISKNETELYPCDTSKISYSRDIVPILQTNCYRCHDINNAALFSNGNLLDNYKSLKDHIKNGLVIGNIEYAKGYLPMPKGAPRLSDCDIAKIRSWVRQDTLNN